MRMICRVVDRTYPITHEGADYQVVCRGVQPDVYRRGRIGVCTRLRVRPAAADRDFPGGSPLDSHHVQDRTHPHPQGSVCTTSI